MKSNVTVIRALLLAILSGVTPATGNSNCKCIPFYLCNNGTMSSDGASVISFKLSLPNCICSCSSFQDVCCYVPPETTTTYPRRTTTPFATDGVEYATQVPDPLKKERTHQEIPLELMDVRSTPKCGFRRPKNRAQVSDSESSFLEFPWMVAIINVNEMFGKRFPSFVCAGALIHENVVMTVAHCAEKINMGIRKRTAFIRGGTSHLMQNEGSENRSISQIIMHGGFNKTYAQNDIALVVTTEPFTLSTNINILCLPKANDVIEDDSCLVSRWGTDESDGQTQSQSKIVELPTVPKDECQGKLRTAAGLKRFVLHESVICAGGIPGIDTCRGDGGSPLMCRIRGEDNRYQGVGITAAGHGCGDPWPGLYVNVALLKPWIDDQMKRLGFTPQYNYRLN